MGFRSIITQWFPWTARAALPNQTTIRPFPNTRAISSLYYYSPTSMDPTGQRRSRTANGQPLAAQQANRHYSSRGHRSTALSTQHHFYLRQAQNHSINV